ncbi:argininosuccinate lyase [Cesiribacter andamanensis]|uniref:Argininosuccinate lyase n=1 Tax=Cesiribacter andamanensis AMV16 TaxID=1279009 RepID=M7N726_9BACT|nr:argininosuccinate lyase [Cesiribacter andamanensis]EMR04413.1 Argininosuccinate lyase [Cesiribacter andamanensis AMV16]
MKLWDKGYSIESKIEQYTVGQDRELDVHLAPYDVLGSLAHAQMLQSVGLLSEEELKGLQQELKQIYRQIAAGQFQIDEGVEDVHSQVELLLTRALGDAGKKVHSARSRNDQVLVDIKMYLRAEVKEIVALVSELFETLIAAGEQYRGVLIPGYTHLQAAMPSSFGLWFSAWAESLADDLRLLLAAYGLINQNPLGSGAGYGSSLPINRSLTTELLGFDGLHVNVINAQLSRGKTEQALAFALAGLGQTLGKLAMDVCLYNSQNFGFLTFPDALTTGSSIMPHKKNPDVFELMRAKSNRLLALPNEINLLTSNLPSGYHRDFQLLKEILFPALQQLKESLSLCSYMLQRVQINPDAIQDEKYTYIYSVEEVNKKVLAGVPFRQAYKEVGDAIADGSYSPQTQVEHTHEGSIGNLGLDLIRQKFEGVLGQFGFAKWEGAFERLLAE